ncbi:MAG: protoporphyrinogen oxidase, partial [Acidimicrobiia bacterium]|nr:protoporphyrinogen oxidase [Acidimicrobiia bacterium]
LHAGVDDVVVLDDGPAPGGVARTITRDGFVLEPAAGTLLLPHPHLSPVLDRIGAEVRPAIDAGIRHVYTRDRLVTLPTSPKAAFAPLVPWPAKLRALAEPFVRRSPPVDETLDAFLRRRLGDGLGRTLAWVAASGVFAGDPERLSARSAFPAIVDLEDRAGSIVRGAVKRLRSRPKGATRPTSHVPVGGMEALARAAVERIGDRYRPQRRATAVEPSGDGWSVRMGDDEVAARHVVATCRPGALAPMVDDELADVLGEAVSAPVVVIGLGAATDRMPLPRGFGALTGPDAGFATLGVLFESSYAPDRAPSGASLAKVIAGGRTRPDVAGWDRDRLVTAVCAEVGAITGGPVDPEFVEVVRHPDGIPQYEIGHREWLARLEALVDRRPGLHLTGWGYRGVGVAHVAGDATRTAAAVASALA